MGINTLFKAKMNILEVNESKKKWGGKNDKYSKCERKGKIAIETLEHLIIESEACNEEMERFVQNVYKG